MVANPDNGSLLGKSTEIITRQSSYQSRCALAMLDPLDHVRYSTWSAGHTCATVSLPVSTYMDSHESKDCLPYTKEDRAVPIHLCWVFDQLSMRDYGSLP